MKKLLVGVAAVAGAFCLPSQAQSTPPTSSVQIYGLLSAGFGYVSNQSGINYLHAVSGTNQNPRIGFRGQEDLGGGTKAVFVLENGFNVMTGTAAQSGRLFGRQSYVGLSDVSYGTVTMGRQYEAVKDYLGPVVIASNGVHIGDNDNGYNNLRVQNAVKYISPTVGNFNVTALYGFGEGSDSNDENANSVASIGSGYKNGPFSWAVAFTQMNKPNNAAAPNGAIGNDYASSLLLFNKSAVHTTIGVDRQRIAGTGGFYKYGNTDFGALYTNVSYNYLDNTNLRLQNVDLNLVSHFTPSLNLGFSYMFTMGKYDVIDTKPKWHQINMQADYFLSKRTDVAVTYSYQRAAGDAKQATVFGFPSSSSNKQGVLLVGVRHTF